MHLMKPEKEIRVKRTATFSPVAGIAQCLPPCHRPLLVLLTFLSVLTALQIQLWQILSGLLSLAMNGARMN